jgi:hypothetical protein
MDLTAATVLHELQEAISSKNVQQLTRVVESICAPADIAAVGVEKVNPKVLPPEVLVGCVEAAIQVSVFRNSIFVNSAINRLVTASVIKISTKYHFLTLFFFSHAA